MTGGLALAGCRLNFGSPLAGDGEGGPPASPPALAIAAGYDHSCAVTNSGAVVCWGGNDYGQLGDATLQLRDQVVSTAGLEAGGFRVAAGYMFSCALTDAGAVKCWGANGDGQLGLGDTASRSAPVTVQGLARDVSSVATGSSHACAIVAGGRVRCWGSNSHGQLGDGTPDNRLVPVDLAGLVNEVTEVSCGDLHSCALTSNGGLRCWGYNGAGQLGDGTDVSTTGPVDVVGMGSGVRQLGVGYKHTCAVLDSGRVRCWGYGYEGQLGDGSDEGSNNPVEVAGLEQAEAVGGGVMHSCALLSSGEVWCWGDNRFGQLGDGTNTSSLTPVQVTALEGGAVALAVGRYHSCALTALGEVRCWGWNNARQVGPAAPSPTSSPAAVAALEGQVARASSGEYHTCAVTQAGRLYCWGKNDHQQLGLEHSVHTSTPSMVSGLGSVQAVTAGGNHTCALTAAGEALCWGYNGYGQLGDGTTSSSRTPVVVVGLGAASVLETGGHHTCAVTTAGALRCWGGNGNGQLGDGTTQASSSPVDVAGLGAGVATVSAGGSGAHTCAVTSAGGVRCWGNNSDGQLGDGGTTQQPLPVDVVGLGSGVADVDTGHSHTCALTAQGAVRCWGSNSYGKLGNAAYQGSTTPVDVVGLDAGVQAISLGEEHSCAITAGGELRCWGSNDWGQLGDGTREHRRAPVPVAGLGAEVVAVSAGGYHTCALTTAGNLICWGASTYGQLGGAAAWTSTPVAVALEVR